MRLTKRQRRVLAVLAVAQLWPGTGPTACTTSEIMTDLPDGTGRKAVVAALRTLVRAGYVYETSRYVDAVTVTDIVLRNDAARNGRLIGWNITPAGLLAVLS